MKFAHISDLHFFAFPESVRELFSKRTLGVCNYLFHRKFRFEHKHLGALKQFFSERGISRLVISGDFTTTAAPREFEKARLFVRDLVDSGMEIYAVSGNHDQYTCGAYTSKRFFQVFGDLIRLEGLYHVNLAQDGAAAIPLSDGWFLIPFETSNHQPLFSSRGYFSDEVEKKLRFILSQIPEDASIVMATHFPFLPFKFPKAHLENAPALQRLIEEDPRIKLYLHGHRHRQGVYECGCQVADAGSITLKNNATLNVIELGKDATIHPMKWEPDHVV
ncbi:MAG: hypothetical protein A3F09_02385 [Chlamydiae bacterium RIFCSPHIGHO2_12_FULL_49_11]|nr:MAG: hypothetical protein A3F09_02385 [Chlamydiae bacterium RIFCSPHIGHO2_12_FULL_49_11]